MTARKTMSRRRRTTGAANIPDPVVRWFAGEPRRPDQSAVPWAALAWPGYGRLPEWWDAWSECHQGARPPAGYEWLALKDTPQHHSAQAYLRMNCHAQREGDLTAGCELATRDATT